MKRNSGLLMALLTVGVLLAVLLTLNLAKGGIWLIKGLYGKDGTNRKRAYDLAVENGFTGSVTEWRAALGGRDGKSAYEIAVENGFRGSEKEWLLSLAFGENGIAAWIADVEAQDAVNFYFKHIQSFGQILVVTSVCLIAGPTFFKNLK